MLWFQFTHEVRDQIREKFGKGINPKIEIASADVINKCTDRKDIEVVTTSDTWCDKGFRHVEVLIQLRKI